VAWCYQDAILFSGSVKENLLLGFEDLNVDPTLGAVRGWGLSGVMAWS
jgi:ABC-type multidrug transport system fused ATPase/permease subunit